MEPKMSKILCILISVCTLIGGLCIAIFSPTQHKFGVIACYSMFGCTAEEFFDQDFEFYEETGDFRETARINRKGELLINLTKKQEKIWIESDWFNVIYDAMGRSDMEVSPDLRVITVYTAEDIDEASMDEMIDVINSIAVRIHFINGYNGNKKSSITLIDRSIETGGEKGRIDIKYGGLFN